MFLNLNTMHYPSAKNQAHSVHYYRETCCIKFFQQHISGISYRSLQRKFSSIKLSLQNELNFIDFAHIRTHFFRIHEKILKSKSLVQQKKFHKLLQESKTESDPGKVFFNFSQYELSDIEKKLLAKGLNFCLPPKQPKFAYYLVHFELFYREFCNLEILFNEENKN